MKRVQNKRAFATGVITAAGALVCCGVMVIQGFQTRLVVSLLLLAAWSAVSWSMAFTRKGMVEQPAASADERDRYIAQRSSHAALRISNYLLLGGCWIGLLLYGICKSAVFLTVAATLCGVLVIMFIAFICANVWFERHG